jgi:hypothetical protein
MQRRAAPPGANQKPAPRTPMQRGGRHVQGQDGR